MQMGMHLVCLLLPCSNLHLVSSCCRSNLLLLCNYAVEKPNTVFAERVLGGRGELLVILFYGDFSFEDEIMI